MQGTGRGGAKEKKALVPASKVGKEMEGVRQKSIVLTLHVNGNLPGTQCIGSGGWEKRTINGRGGSVNKHVFLHHKRNWGQIQRNRNLSGH